MIYLREMTRRDTRVNDTVYPFSAEVMRNLRTLTLTRPVTILAGENGSGKSTLLHLMAAMLNAYQVGEGGMMRDRAQAFKAAAKHFRVAMAARPQRAFMFTAEDFSRYLDDRRRMLKEARDDLDAIAEAYTGRSLLSRQLASMPHARTLGEMESQYGRDLLTSSHGEGFLSFFSARLVHRGLYLMDEPEGALSFENQLSLLALIHRAVEDQGQVIMATHSPVLTAYPGAQILEVADGDLVERTYDTLPSVRFIQHFLKHREQILIRSGIEPADSQGGSDQGQDSMQY